MLNDDTLLNIFSLYPQDIFETYEDVAAFLKGTEIVGGTSSCMSADDGGISFFPRQFASASILFARTEHLLPTC